MKSVFTYLNRIMFTALIGFSMNVLAQPANDLIADAIDLGYGPIPYSEANVSFTTATNTNDATSGAGCPVSQPGVWYKFTPDVSGNIAAGIINPSNAVVVFYEGPETGVTNGMQLLYVDQATNTCDYGSTSSINAVAGSTYYIYLRNEVDSNVFINSVNIFGAPENDMLENATNLNGLVDYFDPKIHFLTATSTNDGGQNGCNTTGDQVVWYKFTAGQDGEVVAGINAPMGEGYIIFYTAANENVVSGSELTWVDQPSNPCDWINLVSIQATAGQTYYVGVNVMDAYGDFSINLFETILGNDSPESNNEIQYYPNPVRDELHVKSQLHIAAIRFFNVLGQEVLFQKINDFQSTINISQFAPGMYIAELIANDASTTFKILKQ